jgi:Leucine-rich repeat (LRR) protein
LTELPVTFDRLSALCEVNLSDNSLSTLPDTFVFPHLTLLYAQNNLMTELPASIASCTKLERLNLLGNPVGSSFWTIAAQLSNLLELQPRK